MSSQITHSPKVFISYSWDSSEHKDRVLALSDCLRSDGIDCSLDQYEVAPPEGWPRWMERQIREADFVLMICTETYLRRVEGEESPGKGHGVRWEGHLSYQDLYNAGTLNTKFIPVLLESGKFEHIPKPLQGSTFYLAHTKEGYEALYRHLTNQHDTLKPKLGKLRSLPHRERKPYFSNGSQNFEPEPPSAATFQPHEHPFYDAGAELKAMGQEKANEYCRSMYNTLAAQGAVESGAWHVWAHLEAGQCVYNK